MRIKKAKLIKFTNSSCLIKFVYFVFIGNDSDGSYTEKRFKFQCRAPSPEQLKVHLIYIITNKNTL